MIYAKATAYLVGWLSLVVVLLRVVVGPLWGSATDIGLIAAPIAFALGIVGLGKLASVLLKDIAKTQKSNNGDTGE
ncbi:hypothetical protein ASD79_18990 [Caulobacter sp. Root655]|uniref:hypothetical protein n=1 Tax=Caulobacter sp. Root655 TaxID=1736578 RepID=UPI0006F8FB59|nr:hypothetical protein [Caulobacter sp. Root655]KRA65021.1 hypothetical protein ASD79_18990 [Caulobacter sp. Root655]